MRTLFTYKRAALSMKKNATRWFFLMPRVSLEYLMRFSKIEKKKGHRIGF